MPLSSPSSVRDTLGLWARASNRRRLAEDGVRALVWLGLAAVVVVGLQRIPHALVSGGVQPPSWLPEPSAFQSWTWGLYAAAATMGLVYAAVRAWHRRVDVGTLARRLDREHGTQDVLSTALALEVGAVTTSSDLAAIVHTRARACATDLGWPVSPFAAPRRAFAMVGAVAAAVALLPASAESLVDLAVGTANAASTEHTSELADPTLSPESLERLARTASTLAELERRPGLHASARERLQAAREQLEALAREPTRSLGKLSRAEQTLRDLQQQSREEGLYDPEQLRAMGQDELAQTMTEAIERHEHDTAAASAQEMARRLLDADDESLASMARSLDEALRETPPGSVAPRGNGGGGDERADEAGGSRSDRGASSGTRPKAGESSSGTQREGASGRDGDAPRNPWRDAAESLPEQMRSGDGESARETLRKMAEEMARAGGRESADGQMDQALEDIRRARSEQLAQMNGEGSGAGERGEPGAGAGHGDGDDGKGMFGEAPGQGEGKPGSAGVPFGMPGGKPAPGGGRGSDALGDPRELPMASMHAADKVDATPDGPTHGAVTVIQRFTEGYRDDGQYEDLHHEYESVAESAVRRERIPLTRREYIRNYFQAVRPH